MEFAWKIIDKTVDNFDVILVSAICLCFAWSSAWSRRFFRSAAFALLGLVCLGYMAGIKSWVSGLGGDSFLELDAVDPQELLFWAKTFVATVSQMLMPLNRGSLVLLVETLLLSGLLFAAVRWRPVVNTILIGGLVLGLGHSVVLAHQGFKAGRAVVEDLKTQFSSRPVGFSASDDVDLLVYIGESTSSLHMSLYGYPLATTPKLDQKFKSDAGFVRFSGVRSTHTHTSPSLLRALSLTSPGPDGRIRHWGLGAVLQQAGLTSRLHSVQPLNGSFAAFSKFIFSGVQYSSDAQDRYKGNYTAPKLKDHQLLQKALQDSGVVFFHSYAGHGDYGKHVDPALFARVERPSMDFSGWFGSSFPDYLRSDLFREVADYDNAISYIDRNVSTAIDEIRLRSKPAVLVYFSDHGESPYTRRGHESSMFIDEMTQVPLVIYFNAAYQEKYPKVFDAYRIAARESRMRLLDQLSPSILQILGVRSLNTLDVPSLSQSKSHPRFYMLERETVSGPSRISLSYDPISGFSNEIFSGGTPHPTYISVINEVYGQERAICYHRSNSFAKALRGAAIANCLEFDLMIDGDDLQVHHPPSVATGFRIENIFQIAQARKTSLWIDAKNIDDAKACGRLATYLEANHHRVGALFVEFPGESRTSSPELQSCAHRIRATGARTSYYVPTHFTVPCAQDPRRNAHACRELDAAVRGAMSSGMFSDLSFDFLGYAAVEKIAGAEKLDWNTWAIRPQDFHRIPHDKFRFIIMDATGDPNNY
ncbi:MAG: sulfatase-like hydrolase/transferase [Burkholderiaceae bacterium]|nr:sulfatase-like hydrolase/transferase [Burkholderiaceae bacterium]